MTINSGSRQIGGSPRNNRAWVLNSNRALHLALGKSGWMPLFTNGVARLAAAIVWLSNVHLIRAAKVRAAEIAYKKAVSAFEWSAYLDRIHAAALKQKPKFDAAARIRQQERDRLLAKERENAEAISKRKILRRINESQHRTQKEAEAAGWVRDSKLRAQWVTPKKGVKGIIIHGALYYRPEDLEKVYARTDAKKRRLRLKADAEPAYYRGTRYGDYPVYAESDYEPMPRKMKRIQNPLAHVRRAKARTKAKARRLTNRYPHWRDALPDAAEAMFNLNRYAKHRSCTQENREDIYDMKNRLVRLLYKLGMCESAHLHQVPMPGKPCYGCNGTGKATRKFDRLDYEEEDFDDSDLTCYRCGGSGWYQQPTTFENICFKFSIGGKPYCWHQPKGSVDFEYRLVEASNDWVPDQGAKELTIPRSRLSKAKEVVHYVLAAGEAEAPSSVVA